MHTLNEKKADEELLQLVVKKNMLEMVLKAKSKLAARSTEICPTPKIVHPTTKSKRDDSELICNRRATEFLQNYTIEDVTCTLSQEKKHYLYRGNVQTAIFSFDLELEVKIEDEANFQIISIDANLPNIQQCYMLEIEPWFVGLSSTTAFHLFMKNISMYRHKYATRESIINELAVFHKSAVLIASCDEGNGGKLITFHAPNKVEHVYATLLWCLLYDQNSIQIEHEISIENTDVEFKKKHKTILKKLCKNGIEDCVMKGLWDEFFTAIREN